MRNGGGIFWSSHEWTKRNSGLLPTILHTSILSYNVLEARENARLIKGVTSIKEVISFAMIIDFFIYTIKSSYKMVKNVNNKMGNGSQIFIHLCNL